MNKIQNIRAQIKDGCQQETSTHMFMCELATFKRNYPNRDQGFRVDNAKRKLDVNKKMYQRWS